MNKLLTIINKKMWKNIHKLVIIKIILQNIK